MIVKSLITVFAAIAFLALPLGVSAKTVCTQEYGQAVVCHEEEEQVLGVHTPIETGIEDYFVPTAAVLLIAATALQYASKKAKASYFAE